MENFRITIGRQYGSGGKEIGMILSQKLGIPFYGKEELMLSMTSEHPERIVFGVEDNVLPALCDAIEGKQAGDVFDITLTPEEGFGPRRDEHVMELARELFEVDGKFDDKHVYEGASITMMTAEGMPVSGLVEKVTGINVTVDFNHPLAGKTVHFKGRILLVRDATEKELHPVAADAAIDIFQKNSEYKKRPVEAGLFFVE